MVTMVTATHGMAAGTRRGQQRAGGRRANRITRYTIHGVTTHWPGHIAKYIERRKIYSPPTAAVSLIVMQCKVGVPPFVWRLIGRV